MKKFSFMSFIYGGYGAILITITCLLVGETIFNSLLIGAAHFFIEPSFNVFKKIDEPIENKPVNQSEDQTPIDNVQEPTKKSLKYSSNR